MDPFESLAPLVEAATVRIQDPPRGYADGESTTGPRGSGFFVAPNWVLTCAHVALGGGPAEGGGREVGLIFGDMTSPALGLVEWAEPMEHRGEGRWPAPDLALVRLVDPIPHECVWLTERTARVFTSKEVAFFGCVAPDGEAGRIAHLSGRCTIRGEMGGDGQLKLGPEDEVPRGVSGGPLVDLERGEVIGVLKARRTGRDGGLATSVLQLRRLPRPAGPVAAEADDTYQRVMHAHDRHHAARHRDDHAADATWTDAQSDLRATGERALSPGERVELLGLLAELPPPTSSASLDRLVTEVLHRSYKEPLPAPRGWRDGLGRLYDPGQGQDELEVVLRYAVLAATADRPHPARPGTEEALLAWAHRTAAGAPDLSRWFRTTLRQEANARLRARDRLPDFGRERVVAAGAAIVPPPQVPAGGGAGFAPEAVPAPVDGVPAPRGPAAEDEPYVLLELTPHGWERGKYDWRVCAPGPGGELVSVDEDFRAVGPADPPGRLRAALTEAFRRADRPERPVRLQAALPYSLLGLPVETWRLGPGLPPIGELRPVVVRCTDPVPEAEDSEELFALRLRRWDRVHQGPMRSEVLDCAHEEPRPLPEPAALIGRDQSTVPVLCRTPASGGEPAALHRVMASGYNVILWRREPPARPAECAGFHGGVQRTVALADRAGRLPAALWRLRARAAEDAAETSWSHGLALLYADPGHPLPGADDPLEAP
ncbi:trypsin-like peptidase domain-containing protein [Streptomyces hoynatensis]|uniref:Serine protease n=1 Tax=Streptomyces hoynatensis TaxID=1141874 RepID=A0A3A9YWS3_9ACTN|nr:trypsin-like peptidase domain-containing protein [Streptomyces hoynatensis]RKN40458.1 serine protease [Streptomyces hoynatensis]